MMDVSSPKSTAKSELTLKKRPSLLLTVVVGISLLGVSLLRFSHAATMSVVTEAEHGTLSGSATVISDGATSGGKGIDFASQNTGGGGTGQTMPVGDLPGWHQVFTDDFTTNSALGNGFPGTAYVNKWDTYGDVADTNDKNVPAYHLVYYTNQKTVSVNNGILDIYAHTENGKHMCAEFSPKVTPQTYGRYSFRYRVDTIPHFGGVWLTWPNDYVWPAHGEIDYPEAGFSGYNMFANAHYADPNGGVDNYDTHVTGQNWHTYTFDWSPGKETFYLDGAVIGTSTHEVPNLPMYFAYQCGYNNGSLDGTEQGHVQIDWVTVYTKA